MWPSHEFLQKFQKDFWKLQKFVLPVQQPGCRRPIPERKKISVLKKELPESIPQNFSSVLYIEINGYMCLLPL